MARQARDWQATPMTAEETAPAKRDIAASFSRAAHTYDSVARLQRAVAGQLLERLGAAPAAATVLDLGCGTGYLRGALQARCPRARYVGLDLARGMIEFARAREGGGALWLVGDAEALPLASCSVDLVFSSLAVQWCHRPEGFLAEIARVLVPGGRCVFSSLGPDTLHELRAAWAAVDCHRHVNAFVPPAELQRAAERVPGIRLALVTERHTMHYARVGELLGELKALGAHNMNRGRQTGLTSRRTLQGMVQGYEAFRVDGRLPATYEVVFGELRKA